MIRFLPLLAGAVLGADFPADTLLPSRRVETYVPTQAQKEVVQYTYARDARDRLYETSSYTYADWPGTRLDVVITDREGRYRGGSIKRSSSPLITFEPVYGPEGRMDRRIIRMDTLTAVEHNRFDERGNVVEMFRVNGNDTSHREYYPHTYDTEGRIATRKDYDEDSLNSTQVFRYDSQGRLAALVEYGRDWNLVDSTVFEYRPDGRVHRESRYQQFGGSPREIVTWEYKVWQVPLSLARREGRKPVGYLVEYPVAAAFDPLGRLVPPRRTRESVPWYIRP